MAKCGVINWYGVYGQNPAGNTVQYDHIDVKPANWDVTAPGLWVGYTVIRYTSTVNGKSVGGSTTTNVLRNSPVTSWIAQLNNC